MPLAADPSAQCSEWSERPNPRNFTNEVTSSDTFWNKRTHLATGAVDYVSPLTKTHSYEHELFHGIEICNFHRRRNSGELLPHTAYTRSSVTTKAKGHFEVTGSDYRNERIGPGPFMLLGDPVPRTDRNQLMYDYIKDLGIDPYIEVQRAASKIYSQGWDALTFTAELHKTVRMFRDLVPKLLNIFKHPEILKHYQTPFSLWMEGRYGWRILLYDIEEIVRTYNAWDEKVQTRHSERVGNNYPRTETETIQLVAGSGTFTVDQVDTWDLSVRGAVTADFVPSTVQINPLTTAWELVTLSFVVDWFLNVGQALNAMSFLALADNYVASIGYHCDYSRVLSNSNVTWNTGFTGEYSQESTYSGNYKVRIPAGVPYSPFINVRLDSLKVTDVLALVMQALRTYLKGKVGY